MRTHPVDTMVATEPAGLGKAAGVGGRPEGGRRVAAARGEAVTQAAVVVREPRGGRQEGKEVDWPAWKVAAGLEEGSWERTAVQVTD